VTGVGIKMENFSNFLARKQEKYERSIFLVDETERIQAHPDAGMIGTPVRELPGLEAIADSLLASSEEPVDGSYNYEGDTFLVTARYIPKLDWHLFVEQNQSAALRNARNSFRRTILIGLATSALIILLSFLTIGHYQQSLERLAVTDELTGAANRREFHRQIEQGLYRNRRYRLPLSLILLDVDHFKQINDRHGHLHGDRVLRRISQLIRSRIRPDDLLARWGGDEFVLLLECRMEEALRTADRLKENLAAEDIGVSMGIATLALDASEEVTAEELVARADQALYTSKRKGRGRITAAGTEASGWRGTEDPEPHEPNGPDGSQKQSPDERP
jgi:diguanylate cyclase (GGDEF)-like protein